MTERPYDTPTSSLPHDETLGGSTASRDVLGDDTYSSGTSFDSGTYTSADSGSSDTKQVVAGEAASVASDAKQSGKRVADTATSEAKDVASEAAAQARSLFDQVKSELSGQATSQSHRAVVGIRSLADELGQMTSSSEQKGVASDLAQQASSRVHGLADWLESREPADLLNEARDFARRRPGAFLAGAALLGLVGGRLTRGLTGDDSSSSGQASRYGMGVGEPMYASTTAPVDYGTGTSAVDYDTGTAPAGYAGTSAGFAGTTGSGYATGDDDVFDQASDPTRVDAGADPATYTYPAPTSDQGASRLDEDLR